MPTIQPLIPGCYFHIYNKGVNGINLFCKSDNYEYFLRLYDQHIDPVADTFAWCLLGNHFHLLVRIKEAEDIVIERIPKRGGKTLSGFQTLTGVEKDEKLTQFASKSFSNLFNAYAQALNKQQGRQGTLFERPFRRKLVGSEEYFRQLVVYIHSNPVHHRFTDNFNDYPWSSYGSIVSAKPTKIQRNQVLGWFDGQSNFIDTHRQIIDFDFIDHLIIE
ncbi:MAG: transposase [Bacteroidales bacterium]